MSNWTSDITPVIDFLKKQKPTEDVPSPITEFCLSIRDKYIPNDTASSPPIIVLAVIMEKILAK